VSATEIVSLSELARRFDDTLEAFDDPGDMLEQIGMDVESSTQRRFSEGKTPDGTPWKSPSELTKFVRPGRKGGEKALQDTGALAGSIDHYVSGDEVHVGSALIYARIHQEGGTITAKNASALTIPLHPAARRMGYQRLKERGMFKLPGKPVLVMPGRAGAVTPMFVLKRSVDIPQRRFLGFSSDDEAIIQDIILDYLERALS